MEKYRLLNEIRLLGNDSLQEETSEIKGVGNTEKNYLYHLKK